jgi:hypothetical protein
MTTGRRRGQESGRSRWPNRLFVVVAVVIAAALALLAQPSGAAVRPSRTASPPARAPKPLGQLLTYGYNNARDGVDTADPSFAHLKAAWTDNISGGIYGQPLIDGKLVIVATELDEVYALNASTGKVAWKFSIGQASNTSIIDQAPGLSGCGDISPLGITGTPVIDGATSDIFVAGEVQNGDTWHGIKHVMVAAHFSSTKVEVLWDHQIDPPGHGTTYISAAEQLRSGLTLSDGRVYAEFGGLDGDCGAYQGYVLSLDTAGKAYKWFKVPTSREGAIWAPDGAATSPSGELFVATGNSANGPGSPYDYGDSVIGLSPSLKIDSYFAPSDWAQRNARDLDLGAGGPIILPNSDYVFETGKTGADGVSWGYLLNGAKLGGLAHQLLKGVVCAGGQYVFGSDAATIVTVKGKPHTYLFVPCPEGTAAVQVNYGKHPTFSMKWTASSGNPNGTPIVAGGLVWAVATDADGGGGPSDLFGMNILTGKVEVAVSVRPVEHFATPGAGDGMIFVSSQTGVQAFKP